MTQLDMAMGDKENIEVYMVKSPSISVKALNESDTAGLANQEIDLKTNNKFKSITTGITQ